MSFWRWLSGAAKRDRLWMEMPRRVPDAYKNERPGGDTFITTREFSMADTDGKIHYDRRRYLAACKVEGSSLWEITQYTTDLKHDLLSYDTGKYVKTALDVVEALKWWEDEHVGIGHEPVPGSEAGYLSFAKRHSIHFDGRGRPYIPKVEDVQTQKVILSGKALTDVFKATGEKSLPLNTWENLFAVLEKKTRMTDGDIKALGPFIDTAKQWLSDIDRNSTDLVRNWSMPSDFKGKDKLEYATAATAFVLYMDVMAKKYAEASSEGMMNTLGVLKTINANFNGHISSFVQYYLNLKTDQLQQIKDIVPTGPRPSTQLPLETIVERYDALMAAKNNQPKSKKQPPSV